MNTAPSLEPLEPRIAPATLLPGNRSVTYTDGDGDRVTVSISKGAFEDPNDGGQTTWTFAPSATGIVGREQLEILDISFFTQFDGANLSIIAVPTTGGGDGTVSIGYLNAAGIDLGSVAIRGDLGAIDAGDTRLSDGGIKALTVFSLGGEGLATGAPDLVSDIVGTVGSIRVVGDIAGAQISITGANASLGSLTVGGSIFGGSEIDSGLVKVEGTLIAAKIGGDLLGNTGAGSGSLFAGRLGTVVVGGTIYGGAGPDSGQILALGSISKVIVGGDLIGSDGEASGVISGDSLGTLTIDGSVLGGLGSNSGRIEVGANLTTLRIGGSLIGGSLFGVGSDNSGTIFVGGKLGAATITGNIRGGDSEAGFVNDGTGFVNVQGSIGSFTVGGSLIGGSDNGGQLFDSGTIRAVGNIGSLVIKGGIFGGDSSSGGETNGSAYVQADRLLAMTVGGSIFAGSDGGLLSNSGAIRALKDIGALTVKGSLEGSETHPVVISATGQPVPTATVDLAMRSVTVLGRVFKAEILAGYGNDTTNSVFGDAVNPNAQIGLVKVGGDWNASDLIAGLATGGDGFFGDADDVKITGTDSAAISRIASIVIGGRVLGDGDGAAVRNGFGAQQVVSMKVGGTTVIPLFAGRGNDNFNVNPLLLGNEYPLGQTLGTSNPSGFNVHVFEVAV